MKLNTYLILVVSLLIISCEKSVSPTVILKIKYKSLGEFDRIQYRDLQNYWLGLCPINDIENKDKNTQIIGEYDVYYRKNGDIDLGETFIRGTGYSNQKSKGITLVLPRKTFTNIIPNKNYELLFEINLPSNATNVDYGYLRLDTTSIITLKEL